MKWMRIAALLLAISLFLTGCGLPTLRRADSLSSSAAPSSSSSSSSGQEKPEPAPTEAPDPDEPANAAWLRERAELLEGWDTFADLKYERPDFDALAEELAALAERAKTETDAGAFFEAYDQLNTDYEHSTTMSSLLSLQHDLDVNDDALADELSWISEKTLGMLSLVSDMYDAIYANPVLAAWCEENWTPATVAYTKSTSSMADEDDVSAEETNLLLEYDRLQANFSIPVGDENWTYSDFQAYDGSGAITYEEFYRYYEQYLRAYNAEAGALFLKLRDLRVREARSAGFDSYADYQYLNYACDYDSGDLEAFCEAMKTYIAPLFEEMYWALYTDDSDLLYSTVYSLETTLDSFGEVLADCSPRLYDSYMLMLDRELYDFEPSFSKAAGGYTTFFYDYGVPFIFTSFNGGYWDVKTVIHEFGHFSSMARIPRCRLEEVDSIDLAEIDSQGLELLMFPYYDRLFYSTLAEAARNEVLLDAMSTLLSGCMEDEFQREIYANPDMTLEEINDLYAELAEEYGMVSTYGTAGYSWTMINHTFSSPMYYISYALSMVSAMELWAESQDDWDAAFEKYQDFIDERGHGYTYREALEAFGFADPLTDSYALVQEIAAQLEQYAYPYIVNGEAA